MSSIKYLIIVEIERTGFVTEFCDTYEESSTRSLNLMNSAGYLDTEDKKTQVINFLRKRNYIQYHVNGKPLFYVRFKRCLTDPVLTISIMEIDMKKFCLKMFIYELENQTNLLDYDVLSEAFFEKFPKLESIAN
jgi:hypothetical protein